MDLQAFEFFWISFQFIPTGEMSNLLLEDFDAVLKFMDAEMQKEKRKL